MAEHGREGCDRDSMRVVTVGHPWKLAYTAPLTTWCEPGWDEGGEGTPRHCDPCGSCFGLRNLVGGVHSPIPLCWEGLSREGGIVEGSSLEWQPLCSGAGIRGWEPSPAQKLLVRARSPGFLLQPFLLLPSEVCAGPGLCLPESHLHATPKCLSPFSHSKVAKAGGLAEAET